MSAKHMNGLKNRWEFAANTGKLDGRTRQCIITIWAASGYVNLAVDWPIGSEKVRRFARLIKQTKRPEVLRPRRLFVCRTPLRLYFRVRSFAALASENWN